MKSIISRLLSVSLTIVFVLLTVNVYSAVFDVINTNYSGAGSLRQAIIDAEAASGPDTITISCTGTVSVLSQFPTFNDGETALAGDPGHEFILEGSGSSGSCCILIMSASNDISGLVIINFPGSGISLSSASANSNTIRNCYIGVGSDGITPAGNSSYGIWISGCVNNVIGGYGANDGNVLSANSAGLIINALGADSNTVIGNFIGTDHTGTVDVGNTMDGIYIADGAKYNIIGSTSSAGRNIISGTDRYGIYLRNASTQGNIIRGNYIGTDTTGMAALPNASSGIFLGDNADQTIDNEIGGSMSGAGNLISGNGHTGIYCYAGENTIIKGNYIGVNATGNAALPNAWWGISIGCSGNIVGGSTAAERNIISGNTKYGLYINSSNATGNIVKGNYIGTNASGNADLGNTECGLVIYSGASGNTIGGSVAGEEMLFPAIPLMGLNWTIMPSTTILRVIISALPVQGWRQYQMTTAVYAYIITPVTMRYITM